MKSIIIYSILFLGLAANLFGQTVNDSLVKAKADSLIYYYSRYGTFTENERSISKYYVNSFKNLFSEDAAVYNDILPDLYIMELLSLDEYTQGVSEKFPTGITVTINKKEFGDITEMPESSDNIIEVRVEKEVMGMTIDDDFVENTYDLNFLISYNGDLSNFKILGIRKLKIENKSIELNVLRASDGAVVKGVKFNLFYNNELQQTRTSDYEGKINFTDIPSKVLVTVLVDEDEDYVMEKGKDWIIEDWLDAPDGNRRILVSKVKEWTRFSLEAYGTPSMTQVKSTNVNNNYSIASVANDGEFGYGFGLNVSYAVLFNKKMSVGIGLGVEYDNYKTGMTFNNYDQNPEIKPDVEGDLYDLYVLSDQITDKISLSYIAVPIKVNYRKYFEKSIIDYFFVSVGASYGQLIDNSSTVSGIGTFYGHYENIGGKNVNIDIHNVETLDFVDDSTFTQTSEMQLATSNISAFATVGLSIKVVKDILNFDVALNFRYGISNITDYQYNNYYFAGEGYNRPYTSLIGSSSKVSTMAYGLRIGFTYNIFK